MWAEHPPISREWAPETSRRLDVSRIAEIERNVWCLIRNAFALLCRHAPDEWCACVRAGPGHNLAYCSEHLGRRSSSRPLSLRVEVCKLLGVRLRDVASSSDEDIAGADSLAEVP
jgi:hypothetical protein